MNVRSPSNEEVFFLLRYIMGFKITGNSKENVKLCDGKHTVYVPNSTRSALDDKKLCEELRPIFEDSSIRIYLVSHSLARMVRTWAECA